MRLLLALLVCLLAMPALAVIEAYEFDTPQQQARFQQLTQELRCPKCQNQNIADSDAPIAKDLRTQLHRQLRSGADDESIKQYMVERYGEFVLYRPRLGGATLWLWVAPALLLVLGLAVVVFVVRRQRPASVSSKTLSSEEQARIDALLSESDLDSESESERGLQP